MQAKKIIFKVIQDKLKKIDDNLDLKVTIKRYNG